jgi:neutral ceramidase
VNTQGSPLSAGYAAADITPAPGLTLSGFAARRNEPSTGVHDPLSVRALALEQGDQRALLLSFDLLAIGGPLAAEMGRLLDAVVGDRFPSPARILSCTHTHSAPATIRLIGCGVEDDGYWRLLLEKTRETAAAAVRAMRVARMSTEVVSLPGKNFNRRILLKDGSVVMAPHAKELVRKTGPAWDRFLFLRLDEASSGAPIAGILHWAAHPATVCTPLISGDYPAGLCRALQEREGFPFLFLQGASGDLSAVFHDMSFEDTQGVIDGIMTDLPPLAWRNTPDAEIALVAGEVPLRYQRTASRRELERMAVSMRDIAGGRQGDPSAIRILGNILNVPPGGSADPPMLRHIASILAEWAQETAQGTVRAASAPPLAVKVLRIGPIVFAFVAAEVFVETAYAVSRLFPGAPIEIVGYCAPLVGYLPTDEALNDGGYESEYAYRFYGHPAPFRKGSERQLVAEVSSLATRLGLSLDRLERQGLESPWKGNRR